MATKPKEKGVNPELELFLKGLLKKLKGDPDASLTDKMKVVDRILKFEMLKMKQTDDGFGGGFNENDND